MHTLWAAKMGFDEDRYGSLEVGKAADFVVMSGDPLKMDADRLKELEVMSTYIGGKRVDTSKKATLAGMLGGVLKGKVTSKKYKGQVKDLSKSSSASRLDTFSSLRRQ